MSPSLATLMGQQQLWLFGVCVCADEDCTCTETFIFLLVSLAIFHDIFIFIFSHRNYCMRMHQQLFMLHKNSPFTAINEVIGPHTLKKDRREHIKVYFCRVKFLNSDYHWLRSLSLSVSLYSSQKLLGSNSKRLSDFSKPSVTKVQMTSSYCLTFRIVSACMCVCSARSVCGNESDSLPD